MNENVSHKLTMIVVLYCCHRREVLHCPIHSLKK